MPVDPRPGWNQWMRVLTVDRSCAGKAPLRSPLYFISGTLVTARPPIRIYIYRFRFDAEFMRSVPQRHNALATDTATGSASSARVFAHLITSRPALFGVFA